MLKSSKVRLGKTKVKKEEEQILPLTREGAASYALQEAYGAEEFHLDIFRERCKFDVTSQSSEELQFTLKGVDASIANTLRRVMMSEVPTVAIEKVHLYQNTSVIHDETLAHRLGLIPVWVPDVEEVPVVDELSEATTQSAKLNDEQTTDASHTGQDVDLRDAVLFTLHIRCPEKMEPGTSFPVYASSLKFVPRTKKQNAWVSAGKSPRIVTPEILVAKLRPGQEIELECYCLRGIGRIHSKWSPVCTTWYRLTPSVEITRPIKGAEAQQLLTKCPQGVFAIDSSSGELYVADSSKCTANRICLDEYANAEHGPCPIKLGKVVNSYEFTVQSVGQLAPPEILARAVGILRHKAQVYLSAIETTGKARAG